MTKATDDRTTSLSRRDAVNLLVGGAAGISGLALAANVATAGTADPIFVAIEAHKRAYADYGHALEVWKADEVVDTARVAVHDTADALITNPPTTLPGVAALLRHAYEFAGTTVDQREDARVNGMDEDWISDLHRMLADVVDGILARGGSALPALVTATGGAAISSATSQFVDDPIFALIDAHKQSFRTYKTAAEAGSRTAEEEAVCFALSEKETEDAEKLMGTEPVTLAGLREMVCHLADYAEQHQLPDGPEDDPNGSTTGLLATLSRALGKIGRIGNV